MKKNILLVATGSFLALQGISAAAQEAPPAEQAVLSETATPTANGEGATVTRETATTSTTSDLGEVSREIDAMQSVETPSGNATVVARTKDAQDKTSVTVERTKADHTGHTIEKPENGKPKPEAN